MLNILGYRTGYEDLNRRWVHFTEADELKFFIRCRRHFDSINTKENKETVCTVYVYRI